MTAEELAREILEREMTPDEFDEKVRLIVADDDDQRSVRELITWFRRRYPTVEARMAYVRKRMTRPGI